MARIRTIKPEYYRHEGLQDLELANPGNCVMLVFAGLWSLCDNQGAFDYRPRQIKLDILPFLPFDMQDTLNILENAGYFRRYELDGKQYGHLGTFRDHQRLNGKEAGVEGKRYPTPTNYLPAPGEATGKQQGSDGATPGKQLPAQERKGKGKEEERIGDDSPMLPYSKEAIAAPSGAAKVDPLYRAIWDSFILKAKTFTNYPKEAEATKRLVKYASQHAVDDPVGFSKRVLEKYWQLTSGSDRFWSKQPFTPSALSSSGIFDRVVKEIQQDEPWGAEDFAVSGEIPL